MSIIKSDTKYKKRKHFLLEHAKSGRSGCRSCHQKIQKGQLRIGLVTYRPHKTVQWHHMDPECIRVREFAKKPDELTHEEEELLADYLEEVYCVPPVTVTFSLVTGPLSMAQLAQVMCKKYGKFRSFSFGLETKYTENWKWRCLISTMLVCNTRETSMLAFIKPLFSMCPDPKSLAELANDKESRIELLKEAERVKLKHAGKKLSYIIGASEVVIKEGGVPKTRPGLMAIKGVGRHVSSVVSAWVHQKAEFGIDVHVDRIMRRLGWLDGKEGTITTEARVKKMIPEKLVGHFSRAFVDLGQDICSYSPSCSECFLQKACPSGQQYLANDW